MKLSDGQGMVKAIQKAGLSLTSFADHVGLSSRTVQRALEGEDVRPRTFELLKDGARKLLGAEAERFFNFESSTPPFEMNQTAVKKMVSEAHQRGYITYDQLSAVLPPDQAPWEQIEDVMSMLSEMGINVIDDDGLEPEMPPKERLRQAASIIPEQSDLVRFGVSANQKLVLAEIGNDETDLETIQALREELCNEHGALHFLRSRFKSQNNTPQAGLFGPLVDRYFRELNKPVDQINYAVLFARGTRLNAARRTAEKSVADGEWPDTDLRESEAIDVICALHGPILMASKVGRDLVAASLEFEGTQAEARKEERLIEEFGVALSSASDVVDKDAGQAVLDLTASIPNDPQPTKSRLLRVMAVGSALVTIVGGVAWLSAGATALTLAIPAAGIGAFLWEAAKKMDGFKAATDEAAKKADQLLEAAQKQADQKQSALAHGLQTFVARNRVLLLKLVSIRPEFEWAKKYLEHKSEEDN